MSRPDYVKRDNSFAEKSPEDRERWFTEAIEEAYAQGCMTVLTRIDNVRMPTKATVKGWMVWVRSDNTEIREWIDRHSDGSPKAKAMAVRLKRAFYNDYVNTLADLREFSQAELLGIPNFGAACLATVTHWLALDELGAKREETIN